MCANPFYAVLFLGMGFDQFSMNPRLIPSVRQVMQSVTVRASRAIADKALTLSTTQEIADFLIKKVTHLVKMDLTPFAREILAGQDRRGTARTAD
jgi:phosphotransferase system enzyme I (PtsI)